MDADTKLVISHIIGSRTPPTAYDFMKDVASRIKFDDETKPYAERRRVQLTTDGLYWYVDAVDHAFGADVDYAMQQSSTVARPQTRARLLAIARRRSQA